MSLDRVVDSAALDAGMSAVADAIRAKAGTTKPLAWPDGFADAISGIETGGSASYETYDGTYIVDPDFTGSTLETRGKVMRDNITVNQIEIARVSNTQGGKTVYIGGIING